MYSTLSLLTQLTIKQTLHSQCFCYSYFYTELIVISKYRFFARQFALVRIISISKFETTGSIGVMWQVPQLSAFCYSLLP